MTEEKLPISDFAKLSLKIGQIQKAEPHPNADKLLILTVDLGEEESRQIVAGLKSHYSEEELQNKKAIFITNLEPATLRGVQSNGMILAATSDDKSSVTIIQPGKDVPVGTKIS